MSPTGNNKFLVLFLTFCMGANGLIAQQKTFCYCDTALVFRVYSNNTILVKCDTAYVMNKVLYTKLQNTNEDYKKYFTTSGRYIASQDSFRKCLSDELILSRQMLSSLYESYHKLDSSSAVMADSIGVGMLSVLKNIADANAKIDLAVNDLEKSKKELKYTHKMNYRQGLLWCGWGFVAGLVTGLVLYASR